MTASRGRAGSTDRIRPAPGDGVRRWPFLLAVGVMAFNDHALKLSVPGVVTGKLSDVAGLVLLPVLLQAWCEVGLATCGRYRGPSDRVLTVTAAVTAIGFALVNIWPVAERIWQTTWGLMRWPVRSLLAGAPVDVGLVAHTADLTDLLTLPAVAVPLLTVAARHRTEARTRLLGLDVGPADRGPSVRAAGGPRE